jgi:uncharacterized lipoprotein YajG
MFWHHTPCIDSKVVGVLLVAILCVASGCAFNAQTMKMAPTMSLSSSDYGKGKEVLLSVIDERPKQAIGNRGSAYGAGAEITSTDDVADIIRETVRQALRTNGFHVVTGPGLTQNSMKVEIRSIDYSTSVGFFTGGVHTRAAFKGICKNGRGEYENVYRQESEERVVVVPTAETNEQWINQTVGRALDKIFSDQHMLACLSA